MEIVESSWKLESEIDMSDPQASNLESASQRKNKSREGKVLRGSSPLLRALGH